jgi:hypothetical protein
VLSGRFPDVARVKIGQPLQLGLGYLRWQATPLHRGEQGKRYAWLHPSPPDFTKLNGFWEPLVP